MKHRTLLLIIVLLLAACAQYTSWIRPNTSPQELAQDKYTCTREATAPSAFAGPWFGSTIYTAGQRVDWDLYALCMRARGYVADGE